MDRKTLDSILEKRNYNSILKKQNITFEDLKHFNPNARTLNELIYMVKNSIDSIPVCGYADCKKIVPFRFYSNSNQFYASGCCENHTKKINNLKKYGVENISSLPTVKEKKKKTTLKNYGVENPKQNKEIATKIKETMYNRYGGFGMGGNLKNKIEKTNMTKYGTKNVMHSEYVRTKLVKTLFDKIVTRLSSFVKPCFTFDEYLGSNHKQEWQCVNCSNVFEGSIDNGLIPRCLNCFPNQKMSYGETDIFNTINNTSKIQSDWSVLGNKELDIYIPNKHLAIEFNGIYWHSELQGKDKHYHLKKTIECEKKGIQLIHIFETEWYEKRDIVESIINAKLGQFKERIYARKTIVKLINQKEKSIFLTDNHLQGNDKSSIMIGLFFDDELVSVMTFGNSRYNKKYQYEMHRFCNKLGYQIIGGASKLWNFFLKTINPESVITYADRRYSNGTFYPKLGFVSIGTSSPNFFIINKGVLESRLKWQKYKLKDKLEKFDPTLTGWQNMQLNGFNRIWDCGNYVFEWINPRIVDDNLYTTILNNNELKYINLVKEELTNNLIPPAYNDLKIDHPMYGHCHHASLALYELLDGKTNGYKLKKGIDNDNVTHYWLENKLGLIIDPTKEQYTELNRIPPYKNQVGHGISYRKTKASKIIVNNIIQKLK